MKNWRLIFGCLLLSGVAFAGQPSRQDLQKVEAQLQAERQAQEESERKAKELKKEVSSVQGQLVSTARQIQTQEGRISLMEQQTVELENRQKELEKNLNLTDKQLSRIMQGLQTLALRPKELLLLKKQTPVNMFRSRSLMHYCLPIIGQVHDDLRMNLAELANVRSELNDKMTDIKKAHQDLTGQSVQMDRLLQQKKLLQAQYQSDSQESKKKAEALAKQARDLKDLLDRLEKEQQQARQKKTQKVQQPVKDGAFARMFGKLSWPAKGVVKQSFGQSGVGGSHAKGVVIQTRPNAQVTSPMEGVVLFAGPFQNYGQLLIVDHGNEYLTVFSGLDHMNVMVGQELLSGEPIGQMGKNYTDLYLEIRHKGQAIDPVPWFKS